MATQISAISAGGPRLKVCGAFWLGLRRTGAGFVCSATGLPHTGASRDENDGTVVDQSVCMPCKLRAERRITEARAIAMQCCIGQPKIKLAVSFSRHDRAATIGIEAIALLR